MKDIDCRMSEWEFIEKYGREAVVFESYYKYTFWFNGTCADSGNIILASYGGETDKIYKFNVVAGEPQTLDSGFDCIGIYAEGKLIACTYNDYFHLAEEIFE